MECVERELVGFFRADEAPRRERLVARFFQSCWRLGDWIEPMRYTGTTRTETRGREADVGQEWGAGVESDDVDGGFDPDVVGPVIERAEERFFDACMIVGSGE